MWNETNFLLKGFINEVKGALTESGGSGLDFGSKAAGSLGIERVAIAESLIFNASFSSSAVGELTT